MRVAFNARGLSDGTTRGWNRYTVNLLAEMSRQGVELFLYSDKRLHEDHLSRLMPGTYRVEQAPAMRYVKWEQVWLPRQCAADSVDVLHTPINFGLPWRSLCLRVMTLHDAIDMVYYGARTRWWKKLAPADVQSRLYHRIAAAKADRIITVSHHARTDLVNRLGLPADKIDVIHEAAEDRFSEPITQSTLEQVKLQYQLPSKYLVYVGGWETRKNIPFLLRSFAAANLPDVSLVLAGGKDAEMRELTALSRGLLIENRVRLLGWVDDRDLPALYAGALSFVYPSEYEGFGLQLCEAMAAGCPTLAARATSLPEVLGEGGETFTLDSSDELVGLLRRVNLDDRFRGELRRRAKIRSADFSWASTASRTIGVYESTLARRLARTRATQTA
ncbi:MAG TPA: glycosyltransferase family 1 protein [Candidatus Binatus sp.]|nr:glycosyltransferase family 1 protein [Candidatus Binatus sp.]